METSCVCLYFKKLHFIPETREKRDIRNSSSRESGTLSQKEKKPWGGEESTCLGPRIKFHPDVVLNPILLPSPLQTYGRFYIQLPQSLTVTLLYLANFLLMVITRIAMPARMATRTTNNDNTGLVEICIMKGWRWISYSCREYQQGTSTEVHIKTAIPPEE